MARFEACMRMYAYGSGYQQQRYERYLVGTPDVLHVLCCRLRDMGNRARLDCVPCHLCADELPISARS